MECYRCRSKIYNNNVLVGVRVGSYFLCEKDKKPDDGSLLLNWDNIAQFYKSHSLKCNFNLWESKKGKSISFFDFNIFKKETWDIKEWKNDLNLLVVWEYEEYKPTIDSILKYYDSEKAIKYLKERNLKC